MLIMLIFRMIVAGGETQRLFFFHKDLLMLCVMIHKINDFQNKIISHPKQDRFTTCFKTCGTGSLFDGVRSGAKTPLCHGYEDS